MSNTIDQPLKELGDLEAKYRSTEGEFFYSGIQALVRVPLDQMRMDREAGLNTATFVSGYQGSPLGGYDRELLIRRALLDHFRIKLQPGLNEELAATSVMGSQIAMTFPKPRYDGVLGVWYGKAPGLDRAGDAIRHAQFAGTSRHGGVLALAGDDPANKSSTLPSSSEFTLADLHLPTLYPGNIQEVIDLGLHGVSLSRASGLWTGLKVVTSVADSTGIAEVGPSRLSPEIPQIEWQGRPYRPSTTGWVGGQVANTTEREIYEVRSQVALEYAIANRLNRITVDSPAAWLGIVASGSTYYALIEALRLLGLDTAGLRKHGIRILQLTMLHPFEGQIVRRFAQGLAEVLIVEEKRGYAEMHVRDALYGMPGAPQVVGKRDPTGAELVPSYGALDAEMLLGPLRRRLVTRIEPSHLAPAAAALPPAGKVNLIPLAPSRTPYFCSGCPHSTGLQAPQEALVGAGIGCGGMVSMLDPVRVGTVMGLTQMGGEGAHWVGIEPYVEPEHFIQNMGDGTFAHSGSLAIRAAVAAKVNVTYKILHNGAVAMTGGQETVGAMSIPNLVRWLHSEGVERIVVTTEDPRKYGRGLSGAKVLHRNRIVEAQEELAGTPGVTVLIHDQQCAAEVRRGRKRGLVPDPPQRIVINERVCEGCGDCGVKSNCLSVQPVETEFGRKTQIHQSSCNKDFTCTKGDCPSFLTVIPRRRRTTSRRPNRSEGGARRLPQFDLSVLVSPTLIVDDDDMTIRMPGVGGTGVVTVAQVLGTAASLDGRFVLGLDQTGLSQKAGPVVSDVRVTRRPIEGMSKVSEGSTDLYLVFDLLVATEPKNVAAISSVRTVSVVSTSKTPTGRMVRDPSLAFPDVESLSREIASRSREGAFRSVDAIGVTEELLGDATTSNMFLVGVAYQIGAIPISDRAIERAIELNGAATEANLWSFRWGRLWAIDEDRVRRASTSAPEALPSAPEWLQAEIASAGLGEGELGRVVSIRAGDLVKYQNPAYARAYLNTLAKAARTQDTEFAETVARNLYKLMAYKDEYEVARLHLEPEVRSKVEASIGTDVVVKWNLHPPILRSMGLRRKLTLGPWCRPVLQVLRAGRRLRSTPLDPFGYTNMRRMERLLIAEYRELIERVSANWISQNAPIAIGLADLPDGIRGYEEVKLRNVERYRAELGKLRSELNV